MQFIAYTGKLVSRLDKCGAFGRICNPADTLRGLIRCVPSLPKLLDEVVDCSAIIHCIYGINELPHIGTASGSCRANFLDGGLKLVRRSSTILDGTHQLVAQHIGVVIHSGAGRLEELLQPLCVCTKSVLFCLKVREVVLIPGQLATGLFDLALECLIFVLTEVATLECGCDLFLRGLQSG